MKNNEIALLDANKIVLIDNMHFYLEDLEEKNYLLEGSSPFLLTIGEEKFNDHSWGKLLVSVSNYLVLNNNITKETMLSFEVDWTKQSIYLEKKTLNAHKGPLINGLYVNTNHTSVHLCWILQSLLRLFNVEFNECKLLVKKQPGHEKKEIRDYFFTKNLDMLNSFLDRGEFKDNIDKKIFIQELLILDEIFRSKYQNYYSLLFFESRQKYSLLKSRFKKHLKTKFRNNEVRLRISFDILDVLTSFYKEFY